MAGPADGLAALQHSALTGVDDLIGLVSIGRTLGITAPGDDELRSMAAQFVDLKVSRLAADARLLAGVHAVVSDQLHRLPEQEVLLDHGWAMSGHSGGGSVAGAVAVAAVIDHQRRAADDLAILRTVAEATTAAAAGIDQILRTWYATLARLSAPVVAGIGVAEVPAAVVTGQVPLAVVVADVAARVELLRSSADTAHHAIETIVMTLTHSVDQAGFDTAASDPAASDPAASDPVGPDPAESKRSAPHAAVAERSGESGATAARAHEPGSGGLGDTGGEHRKPDVGDTRVNRSGGDAVGVEPRVESPDLALTLSATVPEVGPAPPPAVILPEAGQSHANPGGSPNPDLGPRRSADPGADPNPDVGPGPVVDPQPDLALAGDQ